MPEESISIWGPCDSMNVVDFEQNNILVEVCVVLAQWFSHLKLMLAKS